MRKMYKLFLVSFFVIYAVTAQMPQHEFLKENDINKIMDQIFSQHVDKKEIGADIIKHSFKVYIDQFDPDRIYLLESQVKPYLNLSDAETAALIDQYKKQDYSAYVKLNTMIQQSIERSRKYRETVEKSKQNYLTSKTESSKTTMEVNKRPFAKNLSELDNRIDEEIQAFVVEEKRRFGDNQVSKNSDKLLSLYESYTRKLEDAYLGVNENNQPLPTAQQENLFTMHVLKALASSLDAHTSFYDPSEAYDIKVRLEKEFVGIGVLLQPADDGILVARLMDGGPAVKSGLIKVNDVITEVDGVPIAGMDLDKVMDKIHGAKDTSVSLVLKRKVDEDGTKVDKTINVTLKREPITLNEDRIDVSSDTIGNGIIGKITLHSFYQGDDINSEQDIRDAVEKLKKEGNLRGLILDFRENSGGFLSQAIKVAGLFISSGVVVVSKYFNGEEHVYRDMDGKEIYQGPLVILTSRATASAAEIVAEALQDYGVALIVGDERTYGKGTIQSQTVTDNQGTSYFKVTVGKYYTVSGKTPQIQGVKADIVVPSQFSQEPIGEEYLDYSLKPDTIKPEYQDDLGDVSDKLKPWFLRYYMPTVQPKVETWKSMVPILKKNSEYRIEHNKNYQTFLKLIKGEKIEPKDEESGDGANQKNYGSDDLQMAEAINIVKDMIQLHSVSRYQEEAQPLKGKGAVLQGATK